MVSKTQKSVLPLTTISLPFMDMQVNVIAEYQKVHFYCWQLTEMFNWINLKVLKMITIKNLTYGETNGTIRSFSFLTVTLTHYRHWHSSLGPLVRDIAGWYQPNRLTCQHCMGLKPCKLHFSATPARLPAYLWLSPLPCPLLFWPLSKINPLFPHNVSCYVPFFSWVEWVSRCYVVWGAPITFMDFLPFWTIFISFSLNSIDFTKCKKKNLKNVIYSIITNFCYIRIIDQKKVFSQIHSIKYL